MKAKDVPKGKGAWTVKVGEKGQIVIPKDAREMFEIHPGDTLMLLADDKKGIAIPPKSTFANLFGKIFHDEGEK
ncbi:AbrB/MazE/SpoVT family DNA-binding domain-containing protein [uncultured Eubacterium sp.]|uniref:AbrB/MazE/SpoVT family DNA-binding domain-containing protein n=1 Tax=uncultured Eubacterium sp. TaxID=165185 RepID=UPI002672BC7A|nr:AbrB/MazE/SpoVT family DNA-binding domain-containing protein [uncultured Eubacterium sp.]